MQVTDTKIAGVKIIQPKVFGDARGFFLETFEEKRYREMLGIDLNFVQDNHSRSSRGVLRGRRSPISNTSVRIIITRPMRDACYGTILRSGLIGR